MELRYSGTGTPYILFDDGARLSFSKVTSHPEFGYKYLCYNNTITNTITISGARAKNKKYATVAEDIAFVIDLNLKRDGKGLPKGTISKLLENYLRKLFNKYGNNGYFPYDAIHVLETSINSDDEGMVDDEEDKPLPIRKAKVNLSKAKPKRKIKMKIKTRGKKKIKSKLKGA